MRAREFCARSGAPLEAPRSAGPSALIPRGAWGGLSQPARDERNTATIVPSAASLIPASILRSNAYVYLRGGPVGPYTLRDREGPPRQVQRLVRPYLSFFCVPSRSSRAFCCPSSGSQKM